MSPYSFVSIILSLFSFAKKERRSLCINRHCFVISDCYYGFSGGECEGTESTREPNFVVDDQPKDGDKNSRTGGLFDGVQAPLSHPM